MQGRERTREQAKIKREEREERNWTWNPVPIWRLVVGVTPILLMRPRLLEQSPAGGCSFAFRGLHLDLVCLASHLGCPSEAVPVGKTRQTFGLLGARKIVARGTAVDSLARCRTFMHIFVRDLSPDRALLMERNRSTKMGKWSFSVVPHFELVTTWIYLILMLSRVPRSLVTSNSLDNRKL